MKRAPRWKIWHPGYSTEECSCVRLKLNRHLEWNTPGSPRWYMRRICNGCYRDFVDTKPCRWEKPKSVKGRKPNWNKNRGSSRIECQRNRKLYTLFTNLMPSSSVVLEPIYFGATFAKNNPHDLIDIAQSDILQIYWNSVSETLYQLNLLYLKFGVAVTLCELSPSRRSLNVDKASCTGNMEVMHWQNPGDELKIHQTLKFGRPII